MLARIGICLCNLESHIQRRMLLGICMLFHQGVGFREQLSVSATEERYFIPLRPIPHDRLSSHWQNPVQSPHIQR